MRRKNERRFSGWNVFVTLYALSICGTIIRGLSGFFGEDPANFPEPAERMAVGALLVLFFAAALYLLKELWMESQLLRARLR